MQCLLWCMCVGLLLCCSDETLGTWHHPVYTWTKPLGFSQGNVSSACLLHLCDRYTLFVGGGCVWLQITAAWLPFMQNMASIYGHHVLQDMHSLGCSVWKCSSEYIRVPMYMYDQARTQGGCAGCCCTPPPIATWSPLGVNDSNYLIVKFLCSLSYLVPLEQSNQALIMC